MRLLSSCLLRFLGLVLVAAACLKTAEFVNGTAETRLLIGIIGFEFGLGLWMIAGVAAGQARVVALVCFATFFGVASVQAFDGRASCGCMGAWRISPWVTAGFDLAAVGLLLARHSPRRPCPPVRNRAWLPLLAVLGACMGAGVTVMQTLGAAGDKSGVYSATLDFGSPAVGSRVEREVWVENHLSSPVTVTSVRTSCPCLAVRLRRPVLEPGERVAAEIVLDLGREPNFRGDLRIQAQGLTQDGTQVFVLHVLARVE